MTPEEKAELAQYEEYAALEQKYGSGKSDSSPVDASPEKSPKDPVTDTLGIGKNGTDLLHGFTQGALMGGADEVGGGLDAIMDKVKGIGHNIAPSLVDESPTQANAKLKDQGFTGDIGPTNESEMYRQGQQDTKKDFDASAARSPYLYKGAELAGGLSTGIPASRLAEMGLAKGVGLAGEMSPEIAAAADKLNQLRAMKGVTGFGTRLATNAAKSVAIGAPIGATAAALGSDGKLIGGSDADQKQVLDDTLHGVKNGSLWGMGLSAASDIVPALPDAGKAVVNKIGDIKDHLADDNQFIRQADLAYQTGKEGLGFKGEAARRRIQDETSNIAGDTVNAFGEMRSKLGGELGDAVDKAKTLFNPQSSPKMAKALDDVASQVESNPSIISDGRGDEVLDAINAFREGKMNARQAFELRKLLKSNLDLSNRPLYNSMKNASDKILSNLSYVDAAKNEAVPGFSAANKNFSSFAEAGPETVLNKGVPAEFRRYYQSDKTAPEADMYGTLTTAINNSGRPGTSSDPAKRLVDMLEKNVNGFEASDPGKFQQMTGKNPQELIDNLRKQGDIAGIRRVLESEHSHGGSLENMLGLLNPLNPRTITYNLSNLAGRGIRSAGKGYDAVSKVGSSLYKAAPEQLKGVASDLMQNQATTHLGQALQDAVDSGDNNKKNAILFSILQNPQTRQKYQPQDEENK